MGSTKHNTGMSEPKEDAGDAESHQGNMGKHKGGGIAQNGIMFCQKCSAELLRALVEDTIRQGRSQEYPRKGLRQQSDADSTMDWLLKGVHHQ